MQIVALDGWKLLALMLAGGIFALAGLWLMFRPQPAGEANRFEFLGVKIQASSAGLLVFLIGAAFLTMPIFVPERTGSPGAVAAVQAGASAGQAPVLVPPRQRATGREAEPNNEPETANQIQPGESVAGVVTSYSEDWFVVPVDAAAPLLHLRLRTLKGSSCRIYFYSSAERELRDAAWFPDEHTREDWRLTLDGSEAVFLRLLANHIDCEYELFTSTFDA